MFGATVGLLKTEAYKLYSRVFWIFLPNFIKIDPYNYELHRFKVGAFFCDTVCLIPRSFAIVSANVYRGYISWYIIWNVEM